MSDRQTAQTTILLQLYWGLRGNNDGNNLKKLKSDSSLTVVISCANMVRQLYFMSECHVTFRI